MVKNRNAKKRKKRKKSLHLSVEVFRAAGDNGDNEANKYCKWKQMNHKDVTCKLAPTVIDCSSMNIIIQQMNKEMNGCISGVLNFYFYKDYNERLKGGKF